MEHLVESLLHALQGFFLFNKAEPVGFNSSFFGGNGCLQLGSLVGFGCLLFVQFFVLYMKTFQRRLGQFYAYLPVILLDFIIFFCLFSLIFKSFQLIVNFEQ